jgi:hypothetical protein
MFRRGALSSATSPRRGRAGGAARLQPPNNDWIFCAASRPTAVRSARRSWRARTIPRPSIRIPPPAPAPWRQRGTGAHPRWRLRRRARCRHVPPSPPATTFVQVGTRTSDAIGALVVLAIFAPAPSGGTMFLALLVGRGRLFQFRPTVSAVVNDERSPAVTRSPGTKSHWSEPAQPTISSQVRVYENTGNPWGIHGQWLSLASKGRQIE